jgi:hypothetical protein
MGKGTITGEIGDGKYNVEIDTGSAALAARVAKLNAEIVEWQAEKVTADAFLVAELAKGPPLLANIDALIGAYKTATSTGEGVEEALVAVNAAVVARAEWNLSIFSAGAPADQLASLIAQAQKDIATLNGFDVTSNASLWCADFTLEADGECGIIEVPGESKTLLIVPEALAPTIDDGEVVARPVQDSAQLFYNLAILPGWQKFKPTYRFGTLAAIDYDGDTGSVTLETAYSSAQNLNVNQTGFLSNVPIEYMTCNAAAFDNGDQVVVKFTGQDWAAPKVVGFKSNPKPCGAYKLAFLIGAQAQTIIPPTVGAPTGDEILTITYPSPGLRVYERQYTANTRLPWPPASGVNNQSLYNSIHLRFSVAWKLERQTDTYFENFHRSLYREASSGEYTTMEAVPPSSGFGYIVECLLNDVVAGHKIGTSNVTIVPGTDPYGQPIPAIGVGTSLLEVYNWTQAQNSGYGPGYYPVGLDFDLCTSKMLDTYPSVPRVISIYELGTPDRVNQYQLESIGPPALMANGVNGNVPNQQIPNFFNGTVNSKAIQSLSMAIYKRKGGG